MTSNESNVVSEFLGVLKISRYMKYCNGVVWISVFFHITVQTKVNLGEKKVRLPLRRERTYNEIQNVTRVSMSVCYLKVSESKRLLLSSFLLPLPPSLLSSLSTLLMCLSPCVTTCEPFSRIP